MGWPSPLYTALFKKNITFCPSSAPPSFSIDDNIFDVKKEIKRLLLISCSKIAQYPNVINQLQNDFNFSIDRLRQIFSLPLSVVLESYVKGFQFKVLNSILYRGKALKRTTYVHFARQNRKPCTTFFLSMLLY